MTYYWIISVILILGIKKLQCFDENDVSITISTESNNGQPVVLHIEGSPNVWTEQFWNSSVTPAIGRLRGTNGVHLFKKMASSYPLRKLVWNDAVKGDIVFAPMQLGVSNSDVTFSTTHLYTSTEVGGISVDWTTNNVYWTDQVYNWIMMAKLAITTNIYRIILDTGLDKPGAIKVHASKSRLFWCQYGSNPSIESSDLLGNNRKTIIGTNIVKPELLDIDFSNDLLYWVDTSRQMIESCGLDGSNRKTFLQNSFVADFVGIAVYQSLMFGVSATAQLYLTKISNPTDIKTINLNSTKAYDIQIFGEIKQPNLTSPCSGASCSHFCVGTNDNTGYQCVCSHMHDLVFNTNCVGSSYIQPPVYIYATNKALCWYNVWTPDLTDSELTSKCYITFTITADFYLSTLESANLLIFGAGRTLYNVTLKEGGSVSKLIDNVGEIRAVSVDWVSQNIYWTDSTGNIRVATVFGKYEQVLMSGLSGVNGIVVNPISGHLYWTCVQISTGTGSYIGKAPLTGESTSAFVNTDISSPKHLTFDYFEDRLYWTDDVKDVIESIKADGTGRKVVVTTTNSVPFGIAIFQNHVIWTDRTSSTPGLHWAYKDGRGVVRSVQSATDLGTVILYGRHSQPTGHTNGCSVNNGGCQQLCLPRSSGRVCKCTLGYELTNDGTSCSLAKAPNMTSPLIVLDAGRKTVVKMDSATHVFSVLPVSDLSVPVAIDIDLAENLMFWTDVGTKRIMRSSLDGTNQVIIKQLLSTAVPDGLAVDDSTNTIFYTDQNRKLIATVDYNGNNEVTVLNQGVDNVRAIVLDKQHRMMYWTDWGAAPNIMSASYNGTNIRILAQHTNLVWPNGLSLDVQTQTLYWCDGKLGRIESIKTDGTNRRLLALKTGAHFFSMAIVDSDLYITDWNSNHLKRVSKSGGNLVSVGNPIFVKAYGIVSLVSRASVSGSTKSSANSPAITSSGSTVANVSLTPETSGGVNVTMIIIIAIVVGGVVILAIVLTAGGCYWIRKRNNTSSPPSTGEGAQKVSYTNDGYGGDFDDGDYLTIQHVGHNY